MLGVLWLGSAIGDGVVDEWPSGEVAGVEVSPSTSERTYITPGKVFVDGLEVGQRVGRHITVHNGGDKTATFAIGYKEPNYTSAGYEPLDSKDWVDLGTEELVLEPNMLGRVDVVIEVPRSVPNFEFWVSVMDTSQDSFIRSELATRFLVEMK